MRLLALIAFSTMASFAWSQSSAVVEHGAAPSGLPSPAQQSMRLATTPESRPDQWWTDRHQSKLDAKNEALRSGETIDLVFVGDSITHSWERAGKELWEERYAPHGALNLGFSGDRTEHVLWRLGLGDAGEENNEVAGLSPKLFVVMIGTNNTGHRGDPPKATAAGIEQIVDRLLELSPESNVLLLGVFPRAESPEDRMRKITEGINAEIASLGERDQVEFLNINDTFLADDGMLPKSIMPDALHPNEEGYRLWADAIEAPVARLLGE